MATLSRSAKPVGGEGRPFPGRSLYPEDAALKDSSPKESAFEDSGTKEFGRRPEWDSRL